LYSTCYLVYPTISLHVSRGVWYTVVGSVAQFRQRSHASWFKSFTLVTLRIGLFLAYCYMDARAWAVGYRVTVLVEDNMNIAHSLVCMKMVSS
jgi:hypothetical protein